MTPLPLLMFFVYVIVGAVLHFSGMIALVAAVLAIGLYNGSNAARAIFEAHCTLLLRHATTGDAAADATGDVGRPTFFRAISLANVQLVAFLINAAKGESARRRG